MTDPTYDPASHYDRVTAAWQWLMGEDLHYGLFEREGEPLAEATRRLTDSMRAAAGIRPGHEVLDVGCGTGAPACALAEKGAAVLGITTSVEGVRAATERATRLGLGERARFEERDGMDTGLPDACVDVVWVLESSHLMRERGRLLTECARVLRPGGRVVLCDIVLRRQLPLLEVRRRRADFDLLRWVFGDARMEPLALYQERLESLSLRIERCEDLTVATRPTFAAWRANAARYRDQVVPVLGEEGLEQFVAACRVLESFWDDGTLGYGILSAQRDRGQVSEASRSE